MRMMVSVTLSALALGMMLFACSSSDSTPTAAGGSGGGSTGGAGGSAGSSGTQTLIGACDVASQLGTCVESYCVTNCTNLGAGAKSACSHFAGTWTDKGTCSKTGSFGTCTTADGAGNNTATVFYGDDAGVITSNSVKSTCDSDHGTYSSP
jgi:hypothetical protein